MNLFLATGVTNTALDVVFAVAIIVFAVFVLLVGVWLLARSVSAERVGTTPVKFLVVMLIGGFLLRVVFSLLVTGFREGLASLEKLPEMLFGGSYQGYYTAGGQVYPVSFYLISIFGSIPRMMGLESGSIFYAFFIKIPFMLADIVTAFILYKAAEKYINEKTGLVIAGIFLFCPVFFIASAAWGSEIAIAVPFVLASVYFLVSKKHLLAILLYSLALLTSPLIMYLYPAYIVYYGYQMVMSIIKNVKTRTAFKDALKDETLSLAYKIPVYFVGAFLLKYLISLQFVIADFNGNPFAFINGLFFQPLVSQGHYSQNALSIYNVFTKNGEALAPAFPYVVFVVLFAVFITAIGFIIYLSKKNRAVIALFTALIIITLNAFYFGFTTMSVLPALALLLLSFIFIKDRRILHVFLVVAFCFITVTMTSFATAGYFNGFSAEVFASTEYVGKWLLTGGFPLAVLIICSILSVAACIYFLLIILDISMSNSRKLLNGHSGIKFSEGIKKLFSDK